MQTASIMWCLARCRPHWTLTLCARCVAFGFAIASTNGTKPRCAFGNTCPWKASGVAKMNVKPGNISGFPPFHCVKCFCSTLFTFLLLCHVVKSFLFKVGFKNMKSLKPWIGLCSSLLDPVFSLSCGTVKYVRYTYMGKPPETRCNGWFQLPRLEDTFAPRVAQLRQLPRHGCVSRQVSPYFPWSLKSRCNLDMATKKLSLFSKSMSVCMTYRQT